MQYSIGPTSNHIANPYGFAENRNQVAINFFWVRTSDVKRGQNLKAEAEAEAKARPRPRPKFWPRGHFGL